VHAWHHLEHFFSSLLSSKEFWAAILGALVGGLMTVGATVVAQKQAAKDQRQRDQEAEGRVVKNLLQAIRAELTVFKERNVTSLRKTLSERAEQRVRMVNPSYVQFPPFVVTRIEQNHFIVYDSNAVALGTIKDQNLLREIVAVYGVAKDHVASLNANAREFDRWHQTSEQSPEKQKLADMLWAVEQGLCNGLETLQNDLDAVLKKLESQ
jgi:hypothetical protein